MRTGQRPRPSLGWGRLQRPVGVSPANGFFNGERITFEADIFILEKKAKAILSALSCLSKKGGGERKKEKRKPLVNIWNEI